MAMKQTWTLLIVVMLTLVLMVGSGVAFAATKNGDTGRYTFQDYETQKPGLFVLDVKKHRYVDNGYAAWWAQSKAKEPATVKAANDALAKVHWYRKIMLYSVVGTIPGYMVEIGNARSTAWVAADSWALAHGKSAPYGCAAYAEFISLPLSISNFPEGPAFTLVSGPFYGFNRQLDLMTGAGYNRSVLVSGGIIALKAAFWWMATTPTTGLPTLASPAVNNGWAWQGLVCLPANAVTNFIYGYSGKGISYPELFKYQNSDAPAGDFGAQYKAMSKFGQWVL
jgi:hypothetical protein